MKSIQNICEMRQKIQNLVDSRSEELQEAFLSCDASHDSIEKIKADYEEKVNPYRMLHIGIVGRVKAGKSSLLNSLFFDGKDILPKAATPMTAALTKLYYSEKLTVKINFFEQKDIDELEKAAARYEKLFASKLEEKKQKQIEIFKKKNGNAEPTGSNLETIMEKAKKSAISELKTDNFLLCGEADQYALYKASDASVKNQLGKPIELSLNDISELEGKLGDYVGAHGKFTAITSNVEIGFPNENLKDIIVVDTPGFDDPVASRDAMARDALRICDAIFVLSPTGSFCNAEDKANIAKIEKGEGIQEVFVVASQIDNQLCAPEYMKKNIDENLSTIVSKISGTLTSMLDGMKNEGIASKTLLERLYQSTGTNLLFTSGMCQSMFEQWDNKESWNEEFKFIFGRLKMSYPEYFDSEDDSARAMLSKIGNISVIKSRIDEVRSRKDEILKKREEEFLSAKSEGLKEIMKTLVDSVENRKSEIEKGDIGELEAEKKKMDQCHENLKADFIDAFENQIDEYTSNLVSGLNARVSECYQDRKADMKHAEGSDVRTEYYTVDVPYSYSVQVEDKGIFGGIARFFGAGGYHTETRYDTREEERERSYNVHTVNAHAVTAAIKDFADSVGFNLEQNAESMKTKFKKALKNTLFEVWAKYEVVEYSSNSARSIQAGNIINTLPDVSFSLNWKLPSDLSRKGLLEDDAAYAFEDAAEDALNDLRTSYLREISDYSRNIKSKLNPEAITKTILEKMTKDITKLTEQIQNKQEVLKKFENLKTEILNLKSEVEA